MHRGSSLKFLMPLALIVSVFGCSEPTDEVPGRVAIDVTLTIDGQSAENGSLILRPDVGVACPLVKLEIRDGKGSLNSSAGPVPGQWTATFRSDSNGSLTEQLENSGRSNPLDTPAVGQFGSGEMKSRRPPESVSVTVSDDDPASVKIEMFRSDG